MTDLIKFSKSITEQLNANVDIIDEDTHDFGIHKFGFTIKKNSRTYNVFMKYEENEEGEFSVIHKEWIINGYISPINAKTLGDVFDIITKDQEAHA